MQIYDATLKGPLKASGFIDPNDETTVTIFWGAPLFVANKVYRAGEICRPTVDNGYYYVTKINGKAAAAEPVTWGQSTQVSGTVTFTAVPYDLWVLPGEVLQGQDLIPASSWVASDGVTLSTEAFTGEVTSMKIMPLPVGVTSFEVTNQVRKSNGDRLSKTIKYKVNEQ